jgi:hypothetical protein
VAVPSSAPPSRGMLPTGGLAEGSPRRHRVSSRVPASPFHRKYLRAKTNLSLLVVPTSEHECGVPETTMADPSYILFNKTLEQARQLGARGGRAYASNQRARRARMPAPIPTVPVRLAPRETTAEAIAVLDAQFPWLRDAGKRTSRSQPSCPLTAHGGKPRLECVPTGELTASAIRKRR